MFARAEGTRVRVGFHPEDPAVYAKVLAELTEAERDHEAHRTDLSTVELRPYAERLSAAEEDFADLFTLPLAIEEAERLSNRLFSAITQAKVAAGRFNGGEDE